MAGRVVLARLGERPGGGTTLSVRPEVPTRRALMIGALLLAVVAGGSTGCGRGQTVHMAGEDTSGEFGAAIPDVVSGRSITFGSLPLCVSTKEEATITGVSVVDGDNLAVVAFGTANRTLMFGAEFVNLREAGFDPADRTVVAPCPDERTELALELRRGPGAGPGTGEGFTVRYSTRSRTGELEVPFIVRLCPAEERDTFCVPVAT